MKETKNTSIIINSFRNQTVGIWKDSSDWFTYEPLEIFKSEKEAISFLGHNNYKIKDVDVQRKKHSFYVFAKRRG